MRALAGIALVVLGIAIALPAQAADLVLPRHAQYIQYAAYGHHAAPLVIYDYEPGVTVRPYWIAPWRHRHYFPATGKVPKLGRLENLSAAHKRLERAESFSRSWSNAPLPVNTMPPPDAEESLK